MALALVVGIVGVLAVLVMAGGWVAGSAQPCRHCGEDAPYKVELEDRDDSGGVGAVNEKPLRPLLYGTMPERWPWPKQPHTCPVCNGKGQVNAGFYNTSGHSFYGGTAEQCRTCKGSGIVWQP